MKLERFSFELQKEVFQRVELLRSSLLAFQREEKQYPHSREKMGLEKRGNKDGNFVQLGFHLAEPSLWTLKTTHSCCRLKLRAAGTASNRPIVIGTAGDRGMCLPKFWRKLGKNSRYSSLYLERNLEKSCASPTLGCCQLCLPNLKLLPTGLSKQEGRWKGSS